MLEILAHWFAAVCGQDPGHTWAPGGILLPCCQRCTGLYVGAGVAALLHFWLRPRLTGRFLETHGAFLLVMAPFGFHWVSQGPVLRTLTGVLFGFAVVTFLWLPLSQWLGERTACSPSPRPSPSGREHPANLTRIAPLNRCAPGPPASLPATSEQPDLAGRDAGGPGSWGEGIKFGRWEFPAAPGSPNRWRAFSLSLRERAGVRGKTMSNRLRLPAYLSLLVGTLVALPTLAMLDGVLAAYVLSGLAFWGALALAALVVGDVSLGLLGALRLLRRLTRPRLQP